MKKNFLLLFFLIFQFFFIPQVYAEDIGKIYLSSFKDEKRYIEDDDYITDLPMQEQISIKEALDIPGVQGDPIKSLKIFPGVLSLNDMSGEILIHGSKSYENEFSFNHMPIPYIFHFGGLHSIIAPEAVEQIDAYLGSFDASYGGAMGGVVDITLRYPTGTNSGFVHVGIYDASTGMDLKIRDDINIFLGARRSYFDFLAPKTGKVSGEDLTYTKFPRFYDANMIIAIDKGLSIFSIEALTTYDSLEVNTQEEKITDPEATGDINYDLKTNIIGLRWKFDSKKIYKSHFLFYFTESKENSKLFDDYWANVKSSEFGIFHQSDFKFSKHLTSLGIEFQNINIPIDLYISEIPSDEDYDFDFTSAEKIRLKQNLNINYYSIFAQDIYDLGKKTKLRYGIRASDISYANFGFNIDPRLSIIYQINKNQSYAASLGQYSQIPEGTKLLDKFGNQNLDYEKSWHYSINYTQKFENQTKITVEGYYKKFSNLAIDDEEKNYLSTGEGIAEGVDLTFSKPTANDKWQMSLTYSFLKAKREISTTSDMENFYGQIPHSIQIFGSYLLKQNWKLSFLSKYHTGALYTPIIGTYRDETSRIRPTYGGYLSEKLPDYFTLNLKISKTKYLKKLKTIEYSFEIMNITNHENTDDVSYNDDYSKKEYTNQFPFMPWFDITYRF